MPKKKKAPPIAVASTASRNGTRSRPRVRADGEHVRMTSVHLPTALIMMTNVLAAQRETTFSALVEEALRAYHGTSKRRGAAE